MYYTLKDMNAKEITCFTPSNSSLRLFAVAISQYKTSFFLPTSSSEVEFPLPLKLKSTAKSSSIQTRPTKSNVRTKQLVSVAKN
ncbi:unnamed protein product [Ceratitis capitata]|uniref:(Mediterranean fruit fly) hypothetical protein n=1 Tax=Ceratitis capitata TaxID=7213 RepID=A0A811UF82_CERCA|nr:unnamed protein product [Ceratitis capitata]